MKTLATILVFLSIISFTAKGQSSHHLALTSDTSKINCLNDDSLNLGFERLNKSGFPSGIKWQARDQRHTYKYNITIDSTDVVEGKYSLVLTSQQVGSALAPLSFANVIFLLKGIPLANKHIEISAFLKLKNLNERFAQAGLWYRPMPNNSNWLFYGLNNLTGTKGWKKYMVSFDTGMNTQSIAFGAILYRGAGQILMDDFSICISNSHSGILKWFQDPN